MLYKGTGLWRANNIDETQTMTTASLHTRCAMWTRLSRDLIFMLHVFGCWIYSPFKTSTARVDRTVRSGLKNYAVNCLAWATLAPLSIEHVEHYDAIRSRALYWIITQNHGNSLQIIINDEISWKNVIVNSLRPSDAYMRQWTNHHWFR